MNEHSTKTLAQAIDRYKTFLGDDEKAYAILYTPRDCHLVLVDKDGKFFNQDGEFTPQHVFEARIFNEKAELRWLHEENGTGRMAVISDDSFPNKVGTIRQTYLLWGESVGASVANWTKFAEARIGAFFVPIDGVAANEKRRAQFTATEYLTEYEDGNVAVADERLTGIRLYKGE